MTFVMNVGDNARFDQATVHIVDGDDRARGSASTLIASLGISVREYPSADRFLQSYGGGPGCVISDIHFPNGLGGLELQERLRESGFHLPMILMTAFAETPITVTAMKRGAVTVLEKPYRNHELLDSIQHAIRLDQELCDELEMVQAIFTRLNSLSESETQVLELIIKGNTNKLMANRLDVSVRTIELRRQRIYEKINTDSLAVLVRRVVEARTVQRIRALPTPTDDRGFGPRRSTA